MFKLRDFSIEEKNKVAEDLKSKLEELPKFIEEINFFAVGINISESERAYDMVLVSDFENIEAFNSYRIHPKHVAFVEYLKDFSKNSIVVDYEY